MKTNQYILIQLFRPIVFSLLILSQVFTGRTFAQPQQQPQSFQQQAYPDLDTASKTQPTLIMNMGETSLATPMKGTQFSYTEIPFENPSQLTELLQNESTLKSDVLLSTDSVETYQAVASAMRDSEKKSDRLFRFIPVGQLAAGWKDYTKNVKETVQFDKIGLSIVVVTTAYDSFIWIHSASLDVHQKSAMVLLNIVLMAAFALDRDMWTRMTTPLRHKIVKALDKIATPADTRIDSVKRVIAAQFIANLAYSTGFQVLRRSILSMNDLNAALATTDFWLRSVEIAAVMTFATFAWSELQAAIDAEKNPVAKNSLKRITDVRNIVLSQLASMGMVLQPNVYGISPIIAVVATGAIGVAVLAKSNRVIEWLEQNRSMNVLFREQRKFENVINDATNLMAKPYCSLLFVSN